MPATGTPTTFVDLYTAVLNRAQVALGTSTADAVSLLYAKSLVNQANHDVHIQKNWFWAERKGMLQTHASYTTGLVTIALATRTTVTGTSVSGGSIPAWTAAVTGMGFNNARAGGKLTFGGANDVYEVTTVDTDVQITLVDRFVGTTALTAQTYTYYEDEYALASDFWRLVDVREFSASWAIPVMPKKDFFARYPRNSRTAVPKVCTIMELGPGSTTDWRPRVILHPAPDKVYNIPYHYITRNLAVTSGGVAGVNLSADTDEPILPLRYRHALIEYALSLWYRDLKDDARAQAALQAYQTILARVAGDMEPQQDRPRFVPRRSPYQSAGPRRRPGSHYSTGTAFDELRE